MKDQRDTRSRIQEVALELFTEHGYEATSLREIAERLGVTKAALYYHFKTKDDIVTSFMEDRAEAVEEIVAWGQAQPRTVETRLEILRRYAELTARSSHHKVMRFLERNQTALRHTPKGDVLRKITFQMVDLLSDPEDPFPVRLRCTLALFALHATWFIDPDGPHTDQQRTDGALQVARELLDPAGRRAASG
jgi:AcrR family transcriptional regulator